jgi:transcriptional regulator with XRE-family HTH domain
MATVDYTAMPTDVIATSPIKSPTPSQHGPRLHRIRTVRLQQGASLRSVARNSGMDIRQLRLQEQESTDVRLSDLRKWQKALDVPLAELLVEPDSTLSRPVMDRARMVRLMKTATAIRERSESVGIRRMAQMLCEQLTEIMPELDGVGPWHDYGQRRSLDECPRIMERTVSDDVFRHAAAD